MSDDYTKYPWHVADQIPHFTGALSCLGSGWIIAEILCDKKKYKLPYQRIVFALSFFDLLSSFFYFLAKWAHQRKSGWGFGTTISEWQCEMSGLFIYLGCICIPLYNATLAIYYCLSLKYNWKNEKIWHRFEKYAHCVNITIGVSFAIAGIPLKLYNSFHFYCFPVAAGYIAEEDRFQRGAKWSQAVYFITYYAVTIVSFIIILASMISINLYVRNITKRQNRYSFSRTVSSRQKPEAQQQDNKGQHQGDEEEQEQERGSQILSIRGSSSFRSSIVGLQRKEENFSTRVCNNRRYVRSVVKMAILYTIPFLICWVLPVLWNSIMTYLVWTYHVLPHPSLRFTFAMQIYLSTAIPLQGFFNWFVYMYPRFSKYYNEERNSSSSFLNHLGYVLYHVVGYMFLKQCSCNCKRSDDNEEENANDDDHMLGSVVVSEMVIFADTEGNMEGEATNNKDGKLFFSYNESVQADMNQKISCNDGLAAKEMTMNDRNEDDHVIGSGILSEELASTMCTPKQAV